MKKSFVWIVVVFILCSLALSACVTVNKDPSKGSEIVSTYDGEDTGTGNTVSGVTTTKKSGESTADPSTSAKVDYVRQIDNTVEESIINGNYRTGNSEYLPEETIKKYEQLTNLPTLYITLDNNKKLKDVQHSVYTGGQYTFVDNHVIESYYEQRLQIKGRGNWSWSFAQRPYTMKFDKKADLMGMGAAKKWVLVTVHSDKTMMHNFMTQKFAKALGLRGTCDNEYIDVVVNGEYVGTYVLTEKIQIHKERIDLVDDQGILFEIEMCYRHSCNRCVVLYENRSDRSRTIHLELLKYKDWDLDKLTRAQQSFLNDKLILMQQYFDLFAKCMQEDDWETLTRMMDVDSFVNWYLLNELTRNYDSAFVTSCYCFINEDNKVCMGPVWDFDTCYGIQDSSYNSQHIQDAPWFGWLIRNCPEFVELVEKRWTEIRQKDGLLYDFYTAIDAIAEYISVSEKMEHELYPTSELLNVPFDEAVKYFKTWLKNRVVWMDAQFLIEDAEDSEIDKTVMFTTTTRRHGKSDPSTNP